MRYINVPAGANAQYVLENLPSGGLVLAVVAEENYDDWQNNLLALGQLHGSPALHLFPAADAFTRMSTLSFLLERPSGVVLTTPEALAAKTLSPKNHTAHTVSLALGREYGVEGLTKDLISFGYVHDDFVEEKGQYARRGEIVDIWPPDKETPWRLVFNGETLETIRTFDIATQRSTGFVTQAAIIPARELPQSSLAEYLPEHTQVFIDRVQDEAVNNLLSRFSIIVNDPLAEHAQDAGFRALPRYEGKVPLFLSELRAMSSRGYAVTIFCSHHGEKERLLEILSENKWEGPVPEILIGPLENAFYTPEKNRAVFSGQDALYRRKPVSFPKFKAGRRLEGLWEISRGDYVVHERYGIGRYLGLKKIARGHHESEYLCMEYKGGDKLYVPINDFKVVQKYIGLEGYRPKLHSMDTVAWERAKKRAKESAEKLAEELLKLYVERSKVEGFAYPDELPWEAELADSFPYTETEDQLKAIAEVTSDLARPNPMERLICGDVGYGKTEVAIRAAFKVVLASKQVAVLVPTTVLAEQHFQTFSQRLSPFPVKLGVLSRFQGKKEQAEIIENLKAGALDIIIGTHRLLQKDIELKNLGLLIIDEEHRFGVKQKEKIKALKKNVDVLLLSATPIPRTLSLALSNIRDLSVIESPPYGRLPIETHLGRFDEKVVKKIIQAELSRGGQVFYVHNRVETIQSRAQYIGRLLPDVRLGIVHGQLSALEIEKTMWQFLHKELDILMATTIIESGLDIPSVNTMIVEDAENFGLAQLYQLRGRIGRSKSKAYCYLFSSSSALTHEAEQRLTALKELSELGSGFRLALRDLEIRGGGNILGAEQHGFVREVGFELYSRLIAEAGENIKKFEPEKKTAEEETVAMEFAVAAYIPEAYISSEDVRVLYYRRLVSVKEKEELRKIKEELIDRFGRIPNTLENLFTITLLRLAAEKYPFIKSLVEHNKHVELYFRGALNLPAEKILALAQDYADVMEFIRGENQGVRFKKEFMKPNVFDFLSDFLLNLHTYTEGKQ